MRCILEMYVRCFIFTTISEQDAYPCRKAEAHPMSKKPNLQPCLLPVATNPMLSPFIASQIYHAKTSLSTVPSTAESNPGAL